MLHYAPHLTTISLGFLRLEESDLQYYVTSICASDQQLVNAAIQLRLLSAPVYFVSTKIIFEWVYFLILHSPQRTIKVVALK